MSYTAKDVADIEFDNAPIGRRGYAKPEVDALLTRVVNTLSDSDDLTAAEVHHAQFGRPPIGRRGYDERQVDKFLDEVEELLLNRTGTRADAHRVPKARTDSPAPVSENQL